MTVTVVCTEGESRALHPRAVGPGVRHHIAHITHIAPLCHRTWGSVAECRSCLRAPPPPTTPTMEMGTRAQTPPSQTRRASSSCLDDKERAQRRHLLVGLFPRWDLDDSGTIDYDEIHAVISALQRGSSKHIKKTLIKWFEKTRAMGKVRGAHRGEGKGRATPLATVAPCPGPVP